MWIGIHSPGLEVVLGVELLFLALDRGGDCRHRKDECERDEERERAGHLAGSPPKYMARATPSSSV